MLDELVQIRRPKKNRTTAKMSPLAAAGLCYEYVHNQLEDSRKLAFEECLATNSKARRDFENFKRGLSLCEQLSTATIQPKIVHSAAQTENLRSLIRSASRISQWPDVLKWSSAGAVISMCVALIVTFLPWQKISWLKLPERNIVVLSTIPNSQTSEKNLSQDVDVVEVGSSAQPQAAVAAPAVPAAPSGAAAVADSAAAPGAVTAALPNAVTASPAVAVVPPPLPRPEAANPPQAQVLPTSPQASAQSSLQTASQLAPTSASKGFVYRTFVEAEDADLATEQIRETILALGGQKAGEVDLGWKKKQGSYFHFSLPESAYPELMAKLEMLGTVKNSKDSHPRVMPKGNVRFILWVETKKDGN